MIFSLDGLGLLGFEAAINRDYPVMFGTLYVFTLLGLVLKLDRRPDLRPGRSAHRLRGADGLSVAARRRRGALGSAGACRRSAPRRLANFKANRRGYVSLWLFLVLFVVSPVRRADRQRPAAAGPLRRAASTSRSSCAYPETDLRRRLRRPRPTTPIPAVQQLIEAKGWIVWPPIPYSYDTIVTRPAEPGAVAADAAATGSAPTTRRATCWRG